MEFYLELDGIKVYPGSAVTVKWKGVWYDGVVVKMGPQKHLCEIVDLITGHSILVEPTQLKQLDSKFTHQPQDHHVAFHDGETWLEAVMINDDAVGAAKVRWRKDIYAIDNETWFGEENMAPIIRNDAYMQADMLQASRSGMLPAKAIEQTPRTVENAVYESGTESYTDIQEDSMNIESAMQSPQEQYPIHQGYTNQPAPLNSQDNVSFLQPWIHFQDRSEYNPSMIPQFLPQLPSKVCKNMTQSSIPCMWSYNHPATRGIAPHYASNFFIRVKQLDTSPYGYSRGLGFSSLTVPPHPGVRSQIHTSKSKKNSSHEGRRHSLYDQFILHEDPKLEGGVRANARKKEANSKLPSSLKVGNSLKIVSASPSIVIAKVNEVALLSLTAAGESQISYQWWKDKKRLPLYSTKISHPGPGVLQISKVTAQDEGIYTCTASSQNGSTISRSFNLTVEQVDKEVTAKNVPTKTSAVKHQQIDHVTDNTELTKDANVQEFLDALLEEIHISESDSDYDVNDSGKQFDEDDDLQFRIHRSHENAKDAIILSETPNILLSSSSTLPNKIKSNFSNDDMEQYLIGYGENYGALSSTNILHQAEKLEPDPSQDSKFEVEVNSDVNSVAVHTSLGSSHTDIGNLDHDTINLQLPSEVESISDQVRRLHLSIEAHDSISQVKVKKKRWFTRIFRKRKV